jgi:hypothetical protein
MNDIFLAAASTSASFCASLSSTFSYQIIKKALPSNRDLARLPARQPGQVRVGVTVALSGLPDALPRQRAFRCVEHGGEGAEAGDNLKVAVAAVDAEFLVAAGQWRKIIRKSDLSLTWNRTSCSTWPVMAVGDHQAVPPAVLLDLVLGVG